MRRGKQAVSRLVIFAATFLAALVGLGGRLPTLYAQDITAKFPQPPRVTDDYPDDVERWGAFNVLHQALFSLAPKPMSKSAYDLSFAYEAAYNGIVNSYMAKGDPGKQAYRDFNARCDKLFANSDFGQSVLEKYHLSAAAQHQRDAVIAANAAAAAQSFPAVATPGAPSPSAERHIFAPETANRNFLEDPWPYPQSFPLLLFFLLPVAFFTRLALIGAGSGRKILPTPSPESGGLPALPESLRVVNVPGVRYAVYVLSGMELQKESNTYQRTSTQMTAGSTVDMGGGNVHHTAPTTTNHTETTREEIIWVRTPGNHENSWTFHNSQFQSRPGQILSILVRPVKDGNGDIILAYNHTTGIMEICPAMKNAHSTGGFLRREFVQWTANIAAFVSAGFVTRRYLPMYYHGSLYAGFIVWTLFGALVLVTLSFLIVTPFLTSRVRKRRDAIFKKKYCPGLRQYFEQGTPTLQRTFGRV